MISSGFPVKSRRFAAAFLACLMLLPGMLCFAQTPAYTNPETGYQVYIRDDADLLTDDQEERLSEQMKEITAYGGAAFVSSGSHNTGAPDYARISYREYFGTESGSLFLIDMANRKIYIFSDGANYRTISTGRAQLITDNTYKKASEGDYYGCAAEAFSEILILLQGGKITETMRYISNALLALILGFMICYLLARVVSNTFRPSRQELIGAAVSAYAFKNFSSRFDSKVKTYNPHTSGSGGSGGGGGGGGSSGGGGGHSF